MRLEQPDARAALGGGVGRDEAGKPAADDGELGARRIESRTIPYGTVAAMSTSRIDWLDEGLAVLAVEGPPGVRIDRIAARLGLSKGSFHHHFAGADAYKRELLERYADTATSSLETSISDAAGSAPAEVLLALTATVDQPAAASVAALDRAVRAWAFSDADARAAVARVDAARLGALEGIWRRLVDDPARARTAALLPYLVAVGSSALEPPTVGRRAARGIRAARRADPDGRRPRDIVREDDAPAGRVISAGYGASSSRSSDGWRVSVTEAGRAPRPRSRRAHPWPGRPTCASS